MNFKRNNEAGSKSIINLMSYRTKKVKIRRSLYLTIYLLTIGSIIMMTAQDSEDLQELYNQKSKAKSTQTLDDDLDSELKIRAYYESKLRFDSIRLYDESISDLALQNNDINTHIKHYILALGSDITLYKNMDDIDQNVNYLKKYLNDQNVSHENKSQIYQRIASHDGFSTNLIEAVKNSKLAVMHGDSSGNVDLKFHMRILHAKLQMRNNQFLESIYTLLDAEKLALLTSNPSFASYKVDRQLGVIFHKIEDFGKSEGYFLKALSIANEQGYKTFKTEVEYNLGIMYFDKKDMELAKKYAESALKGIKVSKVKNYKEEIYYLILVISIAEGDLKSGKIYRDTLYQLLEEINISNDRVTLFYSIADFDIKNGNITSAKNILNKIESLDISSGDNNDRLVSKLKYKISLAESDSEQALFHYKKYVEKTEALSQRNNDLLVQRIEAENYREKQKGEISALNKINIAQDKALSVRNIALILGSIMLIILGLLLFGLYNLYSKNKLQTIQIQNALADNKLLIKEIHHRVKNNLQVVSSLLNMQARKMTDMETKDAFNTSKMRVQSMSIIHQNLYQGKELVSVDTQVYMNQLINNISKTYLINDNINVEINVEKINMDVDTLVPLGLIANELICNALKYAFRDKNEGNLLVRLSQDGNIITLQVKDNGIGLGSNQIPKKPSSLGSRLIESFVDRLEGTITINGHDGTDILITFPIDA